MKKRGYKTAVITGSFKALAERAQRLLGIDHVIAHCELIFDEKGKLEKWNLIPCDFDGKVVYFKKLIKTLNLKPSQCAYVGDEVNDIPLFKEVGLSIAFNCHKSSVKRAARVVIEKKDLTEILKFFP